MIAASARDTGPVAVAGRWRVILGPCPLSCEGLRAVRVSVQAAQDLCGAFALPHSAAAGTSGEVAATIVQALAAGERVLLGNGPWELGPTLGDPYIARAISLLPSDLMPGIVVGGLHHGHALTELALRCPTVATYVAPPLAELLTAGPGHHATSAFQAMALLGSCGEQLGRLPRRAHVGYARPPLRGRPGSLPPCREVTARTLRTGAAHGPLLAGSLLPVSFAIGRWADHLDGAILAVEIAGAQIRMIDRYMQRLALLGVFERIGALLVGVPFNLAPERPSLDLDEIVLRAIGSSRCAVLADAFVGSGLPGTFLALGAAATVHAWNGGSHFAQATMAPGR
jgi:hypothetical protein